MSTSVPRAPRALRLGRIVYNQEAAVQLGALLQRPYPSRAREQRSYLAQALVETREMREQWRQQVVEIFQSEVYCYTTSLFARDERRRRMLACEPGYVYVNGAQPACRQAAQCPFCWARRVAQCYGRLARYVADAKAAGTRLLHWRVQGYLPSVDFERQWDGSVRDALEGPLAQRQRRLGGTHKIRREGGVCGAVSTLALVPHWEHGPWRPRLQEWWTTSSGWSPPRRVAGCVGAVKWRLEPRRGPLGLAEAFGRAFRYPRDYLQHPAYDLVPMWTLATGRRMHVTLGCFRGRDA